MKKEKPFVSIVRSCYNEEVILKNNIETIVDCLNSKSEKYEWEIVNH